MRDHTYNGCPGGYCVQMTDTRLATTDLADKKRKLFIDVLKATGSVKHAATKAGLHSTYLYQARKENEELALAWDAALEEFAGRMHYELIEAGLGEGRWVKPDVRAIIKLNEAHNPELFREKREYTTIVNVGQDYDTHIPAPAQRPVIEAEGRPVTPPRALQSTGDDDSS
jgi:hypothetical protein